MIYHISNWWLMDGKSLVIIARIVVDLSVTSTAILTPQHCRKSSKLFRAKTSIPALYFTPAWGKLFINKAKNNTNCQVFKHLKLIYCKFWRFTWSLHATMKATTFLEERSLTKFLYSKNWRILRLLEWNSCNIGLTILVNRSVHPQQPSHLALYPLQFSVIK